MQKATNLRLKIIKQIQENHIENPHQEIRIIGIFGQLKAKKGVLFFMEALQKTSFANQTHLLIVGEMENETQTFSCRNHFAGVLFYRWERDGLVFWN